MNAALESKTWAGCWHNNIISEQSQLHILNSPAPQALTFTSDHE